MNNIIRNNFLLRGLIIIYLGSSGCSSRYKSMRAELIHNRLASCVNKWEYKDLKDTLIISGWYFFSHANIDLNIFPNFLIGKAENGSYVGVIDKEFNGQIRVGDNATIVPYKWDSIDKMRMKPPFIFWEKRKERSIVCKIRTIYYGRIEH